MSIYQVNWLQRYLNQEIRNTFYYETDVGEPTTIEWGDIADEIRADLLAELAPMNNTGWSFRGISARQVDLIGLLAREFFPALGLLVGLNATDGVASQIALLISNKGTTTKPNRARTYLCGVNEVELINSIWSAGSISNGELLIDLQSNLNAGGINPLHRVAAQWNAAHTQVLVTNDLSGAASKASTVAATQRRRRIGVGI